MTEAAVPLFYTHEFKRNLRQLGKKYRHIQADLTPVLAELATGATPGDQIPGIPYAVYKMRIANTDSARGKRGGYRMIYWRTDEPQIILITIYSKTEQSDISTQRIQAIIASFEQEEPE